MRRKNHTSASPWRGVLRRHLAALLLMKLAALTLLWALFFSPAHRTALDGVAVSRHLLPAKEAPHD